MMTNGRAGIGQTRPVGSSASERVDLSGIRSANFIRASGMIEAALKGRIHACTRPPVRNAQTALARRRPSIHATEVSPIGDWSPGMSVPFRAG